MKPEDAHAKVPEGVTPKPEEGVKETGANPAKSASPGSGDLASFPNLMPERSGTQHPSQRKIEANRRNAQRSTGPRTGAGKRRSSQNATKLGLYSQHLLITGKEEAGDFAELRNAVFSHYQPQGPLEEMLADKVAALYRRLARATRYEKGKAERALADHQYHLIQLQDENTPASLRTIPSPADLITDDLLLPGDCDLESLLRYEEVVSKQLNHAIAELEPFQERRKARSAK